MTSVPDRLGGRNGAIWRDCIAGRTQEWIADRHGIDQVRVSRILAEVRAALPADVSEDWRIRALESLRHLHAEATDLARAEPTRIYDGNGALIEVDHSNRLAAMDRVIKIQERMAKMLGLDAPQQIETTVTEVTEADIALAELVREANAHAAAEEARIRGDSTGQRPAWPQ